MSTLLIYFELSPCNTFHPNVLQPIRTYDTWLFGSVKGISNLLCDTLEDLVRQSSSYLGSMVSWTSKVYNTRPYFAISLCYQGIMLHQIGYYGSLIGVYMSPLLCLGVISVTKHLKSIFFLNNLINWSLRIFCNCHPLLIISWRSFSSFAFHRTSLSPLLSIMHGSNTRTIWTVHNQPYLSFPTHYFSRNNIFHVPFPTHYL